ncbi:MAG: nickel pincer cofactor biosynthesis protein LarC [Thermodesulfovibrionales bacterium]|nr:nickel pincer cofactor biosynthesis protein LarC [Thermodesulfovibrionales bacterium]
MKAFAYIDCFSGISGDMLLGALVDIGVPLSFFKETIQRISIDGYNISQLKVNRCGIDATKVDVEIFNQSHNHVRWADIFHLLDTSKLTDKVKRTSLEIFRNIFHAEARVHGEDFENVHLHELGGIDCIVDIVGTVAGFDYLGIDDILVSDINLGSGFVNTAHGILPVPAPATLELLKGFRCYKSNIPIELTTPTGAAILSTIAKQRDIIHYIPRSIGYGAGSRDLNQQPNVLRLVISEADDIRIDEKIYVVEANIDDMNPQYFEHVMDILLEKGALDVYLEHIIMKRSRPAIKITILTNHQKLQTICDTLFTHTTTIGLRFHEMFRQKLHREISTLKTEFGDMRIKTIKDGDNTIKRQTIEYSDLVKASRVHSLPLFFIERHVRQLLSKMHDQD